MLLFGHWIVWKGAGKHGVFGVGKLDWNIADRSKVLVLWTQIAFLQTPGQFAINVFMNKTSTLLEGKDEFSASTSNDYRNNSPRSHPLLPVKAPYTTQPAHSLDNDAEFSSFYKAGGASNSYHPRRLLHYEQKIRIYRSVSASLLLKATDQGMRLTKRMAARELRLLRILLSQLVSDAVE